MDYEKKYKEAADLLRELYPIVNDYTKEHIKKIVPELAESEDEKIRKTLLSHFSRYKEDEIFLNGITMKQIVAWIEKQSHVNKSIISQHENKICKENDDSLTGEDERIRKGLLYVIEHHPTMPTEEAEEYIAWLEKQGEQKAVIIPKFRVGDKVKNLFTKDEAVISSIDKCHYVTTIGGFIGFYEQDDFELVEQKPVEWSEKDEKMYQSALWHIKNSCGNQGKNSGEYEVYNWLKSIKDRCLPQPQQEWSNEDKNRLASVIEDIEDYYENKYNKHNSEWPSMENRRIVLDEINKNILWLKSLRPQKQWKPTEEQIEALRRIKAAIAGEGVLYNPLNSLYEQLKAL